MEDTELLNIIENEEATAISTQAGLLSEQRRKAIQYYYGQPYGNEIEGRSQVVTTEVADAVESMLPALLSMFTSSDEVVRFEPQNPDDEQAARQATDYINYIFSRVNNGFLALYCLFKDALLLKNGFLKVYWEEYDTNAKETYEGLTDDQMAFILQDQEVDVVSHDAYPGPMGILHNVQVMKKKTLGRVCIDPCPPEEVLISRETPNDLKKARFIEHKSKKSISQLREMGYDVGDDITDFSDMNFNRERIERFKFDDAIQYAEDTKGMDPSTRTVWVSEAYLYVDFDDDGIAELRKVTKVGRTILDNEEIDSIPFITVTPILMPHKIYGMSIADQVSPIQEIKTSITRNLMDNFYFINNGRYEVLDGMVNMSDLLTNRPGGIVRSKVLGGVKRIDTPALGMPAFELLGYWDRVKEARVGVNPQIVGIDTDALNNTAHGAELQHSASMQRIELIARIFAETGVKDLFLKIMELVSKHQTQPQQVRLRGQWVTVDPREWANKFDMSVTVGLGTGSQSMKLQSAMGIMNVQMGLLKAGQGGRVVSEENMYQAAKFYAQAAAPKNADAFFTNPATLPPPQPQVDPKIQLAAQKAQMGDAQKRDKMKQDFMVELLKMQHESGLTDKEIMAELKMHSDKLGQNETQHIRDQAMSYLQHHNQVNRSPV